MTDIKGQNQFFVYLLECTDKSTYVGATVDLDHRLRQHNKEIKGGAHATTMKVNQGHSWKRICYIKGFPDWTAALQFEWAFRAVRILNASFNYKKI
jgi:predicted GIY-YIG superfamily endonuclease